MSESNSVTPSRPRSMRASIDERGVVSSAGFDSALFIHHDVMLFTTIPTAERMQRTDAPQRSCFAPATCASFTPATTPMNIPTTRQLASSSPMLMIPKSPRCAVPQMTGRLSNCSTAIVTLEAGLRSCINEHPGMSPDREYDPSLLGDWSIVGTGSFGRFSGTKGRSPWAMAMTNFPGSSRQKCVRFMGNEGA
jgi:hypothetical protein